MLSCIGGRQCDPRALKFENGVVIEDKSCGSNLAYAYFVSFIFLCSFLVGYSRCYPIATSSPFLSSSDWIVVTCFYLDAELVRGCYYGQLWLPHTWFIYLGCPPLGRIYPYLGRIRSECNVSFAHCIITCIRGVQKWLQLNYIIYINYDVSLLCSGKILYTEMFDMLKNMDPPLGFGNKCPYRLAYKKLIRMNMPVDTDGKVQFTTTLFALIRENLSIKMRPGTQSLQECIY